MAHPVTSLELEGKANRAFVPISVTYTGRRRSRVFMLTLMFSLRSATARRPTGLHSLRLAGVRPSGGRHMRRYGLLAASCRSASERADQVVRCAEAARTCR
jgi:hypothetical protein